MLADNQKRYIKSYSRSGLTRYFIMRYPLLITLCMMNWPSLFCQTEINNLNKEIRFINESIHGALVLHRVYESYNQEVNKYVDLPSHQLNNYGNEDLPDNVYEDPERWFYDLSPNELYQDIKSNQNVIRGQSILNNINTISQRLNADRYDMDNLIGTQNLNQLANLRSLYDGLERIISYFDQLKSSVANYDRLLELRRYDNSLSDSRKAVYAAFSEIHFDLKKIIHSIGQDNQSYVLRSMSKINQEQKWLNAAINDLNSPAEVAALKTIVAQVNDIISDLSTYLNKPKVPNEYALFGKGYYYQNIVLLTKMNRYGNGYVSQFNKFLSDFTWPVLHLTEEPHYLKIIYPQTTSKEILNNPIDSITTLEQLRSQALQPIVSNEAPKDDFFKQGKKKKNDTILPVSVPSKIINSHVLFVDSLEFNVEIYDHLIKDGDMVSINVNGEWVYNNISLEKEAKIVRLSINPEGNNYIMVQAINEGWRPPNTVGLRYISNGKVENMILKTDLNSTELIEINYRQ